MELTYNVLGDYMKTVGSVVHTNINYSHDVLELNIHALKKIYPFLEISIIGESVLHKKIYCIRIGRGEREIFYNGSFHANEWITTPMLMKFVENFASAAVNNTTIHGYNVREILSHSSIYIVPMVNPDGVDLVTKTIKPGTETYNYAERIADGYPSIPFPNGWKANIEGIDF